METYRIPEENLYRFETLIEKIQKRAVRLSQPVPGFEIKSEELVEKRDERNERTYYEKYFIVEVFGVSPQVEGWSFAAVITTEEVGNVISPLPGIEFTTPEFYRNSGSICQHCNTSRSRKQTFLLRNYGTGEFKQVGSTCLHDFTGYAEPEQIAKWAEYLASISEAIGDCEDEIGGGGFGGHSKYFNPVTFLSFVIASAEARGFYTKSKADIEQKVSTCDHAFDEMIKENYDRKITPTEAQINTAKAVWAWASEYYSEETNRENDFGWNAYVISQKEVIGHKDFGRVAYFFVSYTQYQEAQARKANSVGFIGKAGDKVSFTGKVIANRLISSNYQFSTWLVKFETESGALVTWFASKEIEFKVGETVKVAGTVKDQSEYKGEQSTLVTRCKVAKA